MNLSYRSQPTAAEVRDVTRRPGFTLIEFVLALIVVGVVAALGIPRMTQAFNQANANGARTTVAELVNKARFSAITRSGTATFNITPTGSIWVTAPHVGNVSITDTVGTVDNVVTRYGVTVVAPTATTSISFNSQGVGTGTSSTTVIVSRGSTVDTLTISASGRTSL